jgi:hypothetical protein
MKNQKLQELVSNQVANALATVSNQSKEEAPKSTTKNQKTVTTTKAKTKSAAKATKTEKVTKEVTKQQNAAILEQVISTREVKYIYPEDVVDTLTRKRWRQQTRNELHRLERETFRIKDTNSKEYKAALKAFEDYKAKVLKPAQIA